jgi:heat shock protein HtpX
MSSTFTRHEVRNIVHSVILIGTMMILAGLLGWLIWGMIGLVLLTVFSVFVLLVGTSVSPHLVLRMYGARPIIEYEAPSLIQLLRKLSQQAELPATPQLYYIPSQIANAFAVGAGERGAIAVTDALLRNFSLREVQGVLAHELSHLRSNDGWVMGLADSMSQMVNIMSWIGQILLLINLPLFLMGPYQIPWLLVILLMLAPTISALLQLGLSRTREFQADLEAVRLTGDPRGLASGLAKLERLSGTWFERILMPGRRVPEPSLLRTHPPTEERINRLLKLEQDLLREHPDEHEDWLGEWLRGRGPISTQPRWHVSRFWY